MRIHFQEKPWDLYVAMGYTLVMAAVLLSLRSGNALAILLVAFVPGYVLAAALFPEKTELDWTERFALSLGLSIAAVPLLGFILNFTPWGVRFVPTVVSILVFTGTVGYVGVWRRMRLPVDLRLGASITLNMSAWNRYDAFNKGIALALAASIVVAGVSLVYFAMKLRTGETFTEFYMLGQGGKANGYPTNLTVSQTGTVMIGITNHEAATVNYTVRVDLVGLEVVYNATSGASGTVEINRTAWSWFNVTLPDGHAWTQSYSFSIPYAGPWKVQFLLFRNEDVSSVYRELHLYVKVS